MSATETLRRSGRFTVLRTSQYALGFLSGVVTARALGPAGRAQYALPLALAAVVATVLSLSIDQAAGRMLARREAQLDTLARFLSAVTIVFGGAGFLAAAVLGYAFRAGVLGGSSDATVLVAAGTVPMTIATQMTLALLLRSDDATIYGRVAATVGLAQLALMVVLSFAIGLTPLRAVGVIGIGSAATAAALVAALARQVGARALVPRLRYDLLGRSLRTGLALHVATLAVLLNLRLDLLIVGALTSAQATGLYSLAATLAEIVFLVPYTVALGAMRTQTVAEVGHAERYTVDFARQSFWIAMVIVAAVIATSWYAVPTIFGATWAGSTLPLMILTLGATAFALESPLRTHLVRVAHPWSISRAAGAGLAVNIALNLLLIGPLGIKGAALGSLVSYWVYVGLLIRVLVRYGDDFRVSDLFVPRSDDLVPAVLQKALRRRV